MKLLVSLLLFIGSVFGQNAVLSNFSPTVMGMTIGVYHCYFWFQASAPSPYKVEVACYNNGTLDTLHFGVTQEQQVYVFPSGYVSYLISTSTTDGTKLNYQISAAGPSDTSALLITGTK